MTAIPIDLPMEQVPEICRRYRIAELSIFGSQARGDATDRSDVDLLYVTEPGAAISLFQLARLERELAQAFGRNVDLVAKTSLHWYLREEVLAEAKVIYAA